MVGPTTPDPRTDASIPDRGAHTPAGPTRPDRSTRSNIQEFLVKWHLKTGEAGSAGGHLLNFRQMGKEGPAPARAERHSTPAACRSNPYSCRREPSFFSTFFSPASMGTAKRFCLGGNGQLKL